jgi:hypothetical protein
LEFAGAESDTVLTLVEESLLVSMRALNTTLRTRLWASVGAAHLPRLLAAAKTATAARADHKSAQSAELVAARAPGARTAGVVRVMLRRADRLAAAPIELLVAGEWIVFVHEARVRVVCMCVRVL